MHPTTETPVPPELDILPVEHLPEYVIGFPVYVAITVRARPNTWFNMLPFADFLNLRASIGVEFGNQRGGEPFRYAPKPFLDPESGRSGGRLGAGESRRMLADVSPFFGDGTGEGEYWARFSYIDTEAAYEAAPVTLRFRKPTPAESALLASAAPDRLKFADWGLWTISCPQGPAYDRAIAPDSPLKLNLLLRRLFCGPEPLNRVDPAILDVLDGLYAPEGNALKAELYHARRDDANYQQLRARILRDSPGLAWWIRMIDQGGAFLKSIRLVPQNGK
jgi:hypothetical protein